MRVRTEDLLTIRDGEPLDADLRERISADPASLREVERLARVAEDLKRLPGIEPPAGAWERIAAAAALVGGKRRVYRRRVYWAGAAAACLLAAAALLLADAWRDAASIDTARVDAGAGNPTPGASLELAPLVADADSDIDVDIDSDADPDPAIDADADAEVDSSGDYSRLVAESVRLEMLLAELASSPRLMNAGTALTIADLEDHIVLVDAQLSYAEARDADPQYRQALWRERVDVMNALLQVRYAQAQAPRF